MTNGKQWEVTGLNSLLCVIMIHTGLCATVWRLSMRVIPRQWYLRVRFSAFWIRLERGPHLHTPQRLIPERTALYRCLTVWRSVRHTFTKSSERQNTGSEQNGLCAIA